MSATLVWSLVGIGALTLVVVFVVKSIFTSYRVNKTNIGVSAAGADSTEVTRLASNAYWMGMLMGFIVAAAVLGVGHYFGLPLPTKTATVDPTKAPSPNLKLADATGFKKEITAGVTKILFADVSKPEGMKWTVQVTAGAGFPNPNDPSAARVKQVFPDSDNKVTLPADAGNKIRVYWTNASGKPEADVRELDVAGLPD